MSTAKNSVSFLGIPLQGPDTVVTADQQAAEAAELEIDADKILLSFGGKTSEQHLCDMYKARML